MSPHGARSRWVEALARSRASLALLALLVTGGCAWFRGGVNTSPALRWWLFSNFGASRICPEMLKKGAPLQLTRGGNTIGRFFPNRCTHSVDDGRRTVSVSFGGSGYAWTPVAGRVGFACDAAIEYRADFRLTEDATYVWGRVERVVEPPRFALGAVENRVVDWAAQTPIGYLANTFGAQIVSGRLAEGFTVVRTSQGDDFALGILEPPERPRHPMAISDEDRLLFASETIEVRKGQVDFLGPFEVADEDQAIFFRHRLQGPRAELLVFEASGASAWREQMQLQGSVTAPHVPAITGFPLEPGPEVAQTLRLRPGRYFFVVDHSDALGSVAPPWNPLAFVGAGAIVVSYAAELGELDD